MGTRSAPERAAAARAALVGLALAAVLCGPAWARGEYVGSSGAEVYGHAWVQAWAADAWPAFAAGTDRAAGAQSWPILDRLPTWIAAGLAQAVGLRHAWNVSIAAGVVLAAVGGDALARAVGGDRTVGSVAVPLMPIWLGSLTSGLTEDVAIGGLALGLAAAVEGRWVRAGAWLGVLAWCGLYLAWLGAVGVAVLGVRAVLRGRPTLAMFGGAALAAGLAAPAAWAFGGVLDQEPRRPPAVVEPRWPVNPWRGADVLASVAPGKVDTTGAAVREHPTYLGFVPLGLAVAGGGPAGWLALGACVAASYGDDLSVAGTPTGWTNPAAAVLHALPMGDRFRNHARIMLLGQLVLILLATRGAARVVAATPRAAWPLALAVAAEVVLVSPARAPLPGTPDAAPAIYAALATAPPGLPVRVVGSSNPQRPLFDQRWHGRRLLNGPNRPDPGRPHPGDEIVVAFGPAVERLVGELGTPDAQADGAAAWWPGPVGAGP